MNFYVFIIIMVNKSGQTAAISSASGINGHSSCSGGVRIQRSLLIQLNCSGHLLKLDAYSRGGGGGGGGHSVKPLKYFFAWTSVLQYSGTNSFIKKDLDTILLHTLRPASMFSIHFIQKKTFAPDFVSLTPVLTNLHIIKYFPQVKQLHVPALQKLS